MLLSTPLAVPAAEWALVNPHPTPENLRGCIDSGVAGKYLAAGNYGTLIESSDGLGWSDAGKLPTTATTYDIAEGNGVLVAVGGSGTVLTSSDGIAWTAQSSGTTSTLSDVMWDGSRFLVTSYDQSVYSSDDGVSWSAHPTGGGQVLEGITWNGATYMVVGRGGLIMTSTDLTTWTSQTSGTTNTLMGVTWANSQFVAGGALNTLLTSADGITWTPQTIAAFMVNKVIHDGSLFIAVDDGSKVFTSSDGVTWLPQLDQPGETTRRTLKGVCTSGGTTLVVGAGGLVLRSTNGSDWSKQTPDLSSLHGMIYANSKYLAVGDYGQVLLSSNGANWSEASTGATNALTGVVWADTLSLYVAVGSGGAIFTSPDGTTWTMQTSNTTAGLNGIAWDGANLVASGEAGVIRVSTDGLTWVNHDITTTSNHPFYVHYLGGRFVTVATASPAYTSTDGGINWSEGNVADMGASGAGLGWDGSLYTTGIYTSPDGLTWSAIAHGVTYRQGITHDGTRFIGVGASGGILTSLDGSSWSLEASPTQTNLNAVEKIGGTSVIVGDNGAIFFSSGIKLSESGGVTAIIEGGSGDSYDIVLNAPPTADVVITLTPDSGVEVSPTALTFNSGNWATPQTVTVSATDDHVANSNHTLYIGHSAASADPEYDAMGVADVAVAITDNDHAPVANAASGSGDEDSNIPVTLSGSDADSDPLTFALAVAPTHGSVEVVGTTATYTPDADYNGSDSFTYVANDGWNDSVPATVTLTLNPVPDAPVAHAGSDSGDEDNNVVMLLSATDADGDPLTYRVVAAPAHGSVEITITTAVYTPDANYNGGDSFTFTANDGTSDATPATMTLTVNAVNDAPVAAARTGGGDEGSDITITLSATDVDGDTLTYAQVAAPAHGSVSISGATATYTPATGYTGGDSFTYKANDGALDSATATVTLTVNPVISPNHAPVAAARTGSGNEGSDITITLSATDVDGDALTYRLASGPSHGSVVISGTTATYTPDSGYSGSDSFTYTANDGALDSAPATVTLMVNPAGTPTTSGSVASGGGGGSVDPFWLLLLMPVLRRFGVGGGRRQRG
jgi:hypothetical protein